MSASQPDTQPLVLVAMCGGGWHRETVRILERFPSDRFRFAYAYGHHSGVHGVRNLPVTHQGPWYPIHYLGPTERRWSRFFLNPVRFVASFFEAIRIVRSLRPAAVLAVGTSTAIPLFFAARLFGIRSVFVESLTRVKALSLTGRILRRLRLSDRLYVQWQSLSETLPGTVHAGAVA